jgi:hypothetical protein
MGFHAQGYAPRRGCGGRGNGQRPGNGGMVGLAINALTSATQPTNPRDGQITGIANAPRNNDLPVYSNPSNVHFKDDKEIEPLLDHIDEPPAYTPDASTPTTEARGTAPTEHLHTQAQYLSQHPGFAAFPILQNPTPAVSGDLSRLGNALASMQFGERGSKCAAKRARKQLVRDLWAAEELKRGGRCSMSCGERKMVKAQMKAVKGAIREEIRGMRRY